MKFDLPNLFHFTTTQLIHKMLVHLIRFNLSTVMNTNSLVLMQTLILSVPWCLAKMHLDSDKHMKILVTDVEYGLFDTPYFPVCLSGIS